jgi:hypothetical protein
LAAMQAKTNSIAKSIHLIFAPHPLMDKQWRIEI